MFDELRNLINKYPTIKSKSYVLFRWYICPFYLMEEFLPDKGTILDIGCGEGVFSIYLTKKNNRKIIGIDLNNQKIAIARKASRNLKNIEFKYKNAFEWKSKVDAIIISDAFHHFESSKQELFLKQCYKLLNSKGTLLIKEINKDDFIRSRLSRIWDLILYPKDKINYWSLAKLKEKLEEIGFKVIFKRAANHFPGSTMIYICSKK